MNLYEMTKEEFEKVYKELKYDGLTDEEVAEKLFTNVVTLNSYKMVWGVETIKNRKNRWGITEEHFRKGALLGLDRRIILRRVRDGMHVNLAITTPRQQGKRLWG